MIFALPYASSKNETLRGVGMVMWLFDDEVNDSRHSARALKVAGAIKEVGMDIAPMMCIMYAPYSAIVPQDTQLDSAYFSPTLSETEKALVISHSVSASHLLQAVFVAELQQPICTGDVAWPSRTLTKWFHNAGILQCSVWTAAIRPNAIFVALPDDCHTVRRAAAIMKAHRHELCLI